ncbi:MAG TPA: glycosyltransferase, partial [Acidimicrobiales bacterium]
MATSVLIVSASMGAGHDGAARELAARLEARGHATKVVDFMACAPLGIGTLVRVLYELQLRVAPWAYEATYRVWYLLPLLISPVVRFVSFLTSRRVRRHIREIDAGLVVTTYPLASLTLGRMRARGQVDVPVSTFVTDFAVHPLWVHPGVDLNVCVHPQSAARAAQMTQRPSCAPGPLVPDRFRRNATSRAAARRQLGLPDDETIVLVVAGSWGVGDLEGTFADLLATGRYYPVAVCGRNDRLKGRLERQRGGRALGWTDQMPTLMAAADAIVQNAGGLTCMEAFAAGLPVVSFRPIPGHGRENAIEMERAGVAGFARSPGELVAILDRATTLAGRRMVGRARAMFTGDATDHVLALGPATEDAAGEEALPLAAGAEDLAGPMAARAGHRRRRGRRVGMAAAAMALAYTGVNVAADAATAMGYAGGHADRHSAGAYVAVRLGPSALLDPGTGPRLAASHISAIIGGTLAARHPAEVRALKAAGVDVVNGGWGRP